MGAKCPQCGMTSDRDDICTWCNADLRDEQKKSSGSGSQSQSARGSAGARTATAAQMRRRRQQEVVARPERPAWVVPAIVCGAIVVLLVGALYYMGFSASGAPPDQGEWKDYKAPEGSVAGWYPEGWGEPSCSGSEGTFVMVRFKPTKLCKMTIEGRQGAGAIGDASAALERAAGGASSIGMSTEGALLAHFKNEIWLDKRPNYKQGEPQFAYNFAGVKTAFVEYKYKKLVGLLPVEMSGMRWATLHGDYGYHITAEAPSKQWQKFKPVALKIAQHTRLQ